MKKTLILLICICLMFISCTKKEQKTKDEKIEFSTESESLKTQSNKEITDSTTLSPSEKKTEEVKFELDNRGYFGTIAKTTVNDDNLNIRLKPTTSSLIVGKLNKGDAIIIKGFSDKRENIDNFEGYWLKIQVEKNDIIKDYECDNFGWYGWIFSKYVNIDPQINVSTFNVLKVNPANESLSLSLDLEIDRNGKKEIVEVYPNKFKKQESYYFVWSDDIKDFMYSDPVGTFKWNPKTNEITHMTDMGYDCESAWCIISDDEKYMFQDFGTSPGVRAFSISNLETKKVIYSGSYLRDLEYDGKTVIVVDKCDEWNIENKYVSDESIKRSEEYKNSLKPEDLEFKSVVVRYKLNLENFQKEYLDCTTVYEQ